MTVRVPWAFVFVAALLLPAAPASAETPGAIALSQLEPTPAGDAFFGVPSPWVSGHLMPRAALVLDHAEDPFLVEDGSTTSAIVSHQTFLHVGASLALWDRLLVSALLPVALTQGGDDPTAQNISFASPTSAALGDLRLGVRVRLFGGDLDPFQAGVGVYVHVPTAPSDAFTGDGAVRESPHLLLGGRLRSFVWSASVGLAVRASQNPTTLTYGVGAGLLLGQGRVQVGPELYAATQVQDGSIQVSEQRVIERDVGTNLEALLGARVRLFDQLVIGAAAGPGLTQAIGTPKLRAVGMIAWAPGASRSAPEKPLDTDADGLLDAADACPYAFGSRSVNPKRNGCPIEDQDEDGVADWDDACPEKPGKASADAKANGCPSAAPAAALVDSDGDSVTDAQDACPREKGEATMEAATTGCPRAPASAAGDGDGVLKKK